MVESIQEEYNTARSHVETPAGCARQTESGSKRSGGKAGAVPHPSARCRVQQAAVRRLAAEAEGGGNHGRLAFEQHSRCGSGTRAYRPFAAAEVAEYPVGDFWSGLVGGIGLAIFREYLDNTVKSPDDIEASDRSAVAGGGSFAAGTERAITAGYRGRLASRFRRLARARAWNCFPTCSRNRRFQRPSGRCGPRCCFRRRNIRRR